ncbi:CsgG/HfaB family protein [Persicobacter sp. CCB-QB2]|uniref:CsgG/HfaB family protein n=1 Tax=Persicobacter sp. CCB-QB2 TaxID=1561025 RepID=UPI0006A96598|nr:CsgG/HfaB family protein [Persicobacter sp. CCB-QB2]
MKQFILFFFAALLLAACSPHYNMFQTTPARLGTKTPTSKAFNELPPPEKKIIAAVYKFRDQTGQYKPSAAGTSWSTAVTQGATSILLRSLEESGWFVPIEREGLSNLLNERKIIRSSQAAYLEDNQQSEAKLPPLLFGDIVLEGGIISYDANVVTGGAGLQYFGTGGNGQYREDRVTVYLRAVSTTNGKILKTVYTTKTVLSQMIDFGVFRYVAFKRLLEAEVGTTYNEPMELAVTQAIEKAVHTMVVEGMLEQLWSPAQGTAEDHPAVQDYLVEKELNAQQNDWGELDENRRGKLKLGLGAGGSLFYSDILEEGVGPFGRFTAGYMMPKGLGLNLNFEAGGLTATGLEMNYMQLGADVQYYLRPKSIWSPYFKFGGGYALSNVNLGFPYENTDLSSHQSAYFMAGAGVDVALSNRFSLFLDIGWQLYANDKFDGLKRGRYNDYHFNGALGVSFYLFSH